MKTIAKQLNVKEFPFKIRDEKDNLIYYEYSNGTCFKWEYDENGNIIYYEHSNGSWHKYEYDKKGNQIYYENNNGYIEDKRPKPTVELTMDEIATKFGVDVKLLKIKK